MHTRNTVYLYHTYHILLYFMKDCIAQNIHILCPDQYKSAKLSCGENGLKILLFPVVQKQS